MKIIKEGRKQKGWAKELACTGKGHGDGGCGAILLVEEDDIFHSHEPDCDGDGKYVEAFKCASCGHLTDTGEYKGGRIDILSYEKWKKRQEKKEPKIVEAFIPCSDADR